MNVYLSYVRRDWCSYTVYDKHVDIATFEARLIWLDQQRRSDFLENILYNVAIDDRAVVCLFVRLKAICGWAAYFSVKLRFCNFFVNIEINTSEVIKICEKSYNRLLKYPSVYGQQIS